MDGRAALTTERRFIFDAVARDYDDVRPGYPEGVFAAIAEAAPGRRLLEIGSGTGKATTGFIAAGFSIVGLEPGAAMIATARANPALAAVSFEQTTFEGWAAKGEPVFDAVASAQAWHWIDPSGGYAKAAASLAAGGVLAIFGNVAPFPEGPMKAKVDAAYERLAPEMSDRAKNSALNTYYTATGPVPAQIAASGCFGAADHRVFAWSRDYPTSEFLTLQSTLSNHQMLAPNRREALLQAVGEIIDAHGGRVTLPYETHLFLARRL